MDYGTLLGDSWRVTRIHKYLWILGLFAFGGSCSSGPSYNLGSNEGSQISPGSGGWQGVGDFISSHAGLLLALLAAFFLLGLVLFVVSFFATAALIAGVDDAHAGQRRGLAYAWSRGVASFWRLLGLILLLAIGGLLLAVMLVLLLVVPAVVTYTSEGSGFTGPLLAFLLVGFLLLLLLIPVGVALQIILNWAFRSLVLHGTGVFASLGAGWRLLRRNLGSSLVLWVLDLALNIGLGLAVALPAGALAVPVILGGSLLDDLDAPLLAAGVLVGLLLLAALAILKAASSTFFSAYWTIAYRRLTASADVTTPLHTTSLTPRSGPITVAPPEA